MLVGSLDKILNQILDFKEEVAFRFGCLCVVKRCWADFVKSLYLFII